MLMPMGFLISVTTNVHHRPVLLLALCTGRGSVALVDFVLDAEAEGLIAIGG